MSTKYEGCFFDLQRALAEKHLVIESLAATEAKVTELEAKIVELEAKIASLGAKPDAPA